jgi:hypothetical protein
MSNDTYISPLPIEKTSFTDALGFYAINQDLEMEFYRAIDQNDVELANKKFRQLLIRNLPFIEKRLKKDTQKQQWLEENDDIKEMKACYKPNNTEKEDQDNANLTLEICDVLMQKMGSLLQYMKEERLLLPFRIDDSGRPSLLDSDDT